MCGEVTCVLMHALTRQSRREQQIPTAAPARLRQRPPVEVYIYDNQPNRTRKCDDLRHQFENMQSIGISTTDGRPDHNLQCDLSAMIDMN